MSKLGSALKPAQTALKELEHEVEKQARGRSLHGSARARTKVLIVDDDTFQCKLLSMHLKDEGFHLSFAASGKRALEMAAEDKPDLILLDYSMPNMNGLETLERLRATSGTANVPVIIVTGKSERDVVIACRQAGASDFLVKPVEKDTLVTKLERYVRN